VSAVQTFCGQGGGVVNFSQFCADVFYGRPLFANEDNYPNTRAVTTKLISVKWLLH